MSGILLKSLWMENKHSKIEELSISRKYSVLVISLATSPVHILREELNGSSQAILRLDLPAECGSVLPLSSCHLLGRAVAREKRKGRGRRVVQ